MAEPGEAQKTIPSGFGFLRFRFGCVGEDRDAIVTLGVNALSREHDPSAHGQEANAIAQAAGEAWLGAFPAAHMTTDWQFRGVDSYMWYENQVAGEQPKPFWTGVWDSTVTGTAAQATTPCNVALLVKKNTGMGGRHERGRMFLPAGYLTEASVDARGNVAQTAINVLQADVNQLKANLIDPDVGLAPVLLHGLRKVAGVIVPAGLPTLITQFAIDALIATQRRRLR